jgi:hypothetical protein
MSFADFQQVAEMASHLSPEEQVQLILRIQRQLPAGVGSTGPEDALYGSPASVLRAISESPHVESNDVDALEQAIAASKIPIGREGVFDQGD